MKEQKIGIFIQQLRKENNLTQKELGEQLNITDKAISKWERGLSCPDISLIIPLARILGVSASELLNGCKDSEPPSEKTETIIEEALEYSDRTSKNRLEKIRMGVLIFCSVTFLLTVFICFICDFYITGRLSWSLVVTASLVFSWLLLLPLLKAKQGCIRMTLYVLSVTIFIYLFVLGQILDLPLVYTLGSAVSGVSLAGIWCMYFLFYKLKHRLWSAFGGLFLLAIAVSLTINHLTAYFLKDYTSDLISDAVNVVSLIILSMICFAVDRSVFKTRC